jgi:hypothetical protein
LKGIDLQLFVTNPSNIMKAFSLKKKVMPLPMQEDKKFPQVADDNFSTCTA